MPEPDIAAFLEDLTPEEAAELERALAALPPAEALNLPDSRRRVATNVRARACFDFSRIAKAEQQLKRLPREGEVFHCLMGGDYNASDLVPAVQQLAAEPIRELSVATLGFNKTNVSQLCALLDAGAIGKVSIACSEYFREKNRDEYGFAEVELGQRGQRLVATRTHAKILLFDFAKRGHFVVESSANLRSCNALEQFSLTKSEKLYRFHRRWLEQLHREQGGAR